MFPRLWERAIAMFERLLLSAFQEAERRADAAIAHRFETSVGPPGVPLPPLIQPAPQEPPLQIPRPVAAHQPRPQAPALPPPAAVHQPQYQAPALPPLPPLPDPAVTQQPADGQQPRRPRGRPKKEAPKQEGPPKETQP